MALLITRTLVVPVWLLAFALAIVMVPSGIETNRLVLVGSGLAAVAILLLGRSSGNTAISEGPQPIDVKPLSVMAIPRQPRRQRWTSRW